jgi:hypothetical protein
VLQRVKEGRHILHNIKRGKANWIGHILHRNCLLKHVIEVKIDRRVAVTGRRVRRRQQILNDIKERKGFLKLKEGYTMAKLVEAVPYKSEGHGFDHR